MHRSVPECPVGPSRRGLGPQTIINDVLLQDPGVLERRVERDVDKAIREYGRLTEGSNDSRLPLSRLIEKSPDNSEAQKLLGGEMRLCAPWVDDCKEE